MFEIVFLLPLAFIHVIHKYLLNTYCVSDTTLSNKGGYSRKQNRLNTFTPQRAPLPVEFKCKCFWTRVSHSLMYPTHYASAINKACGQSCSRQRQDSKACSMIIHEKETLLILPDPLPTDWICVNYKIILSHFTTTE